MGIGLVIATRPHKKHELDAFQRMVANGPAFEASSARICSARQDLSLRFIKYRNTSFAVKSPSFAGRRSSSGFERWKLVRGFWRKPLAQVSENSLHVTAGKTSH